MPNAKSSNVVRRGRSSDQIERGQKVSATLRVKMDDAGVTMSSLAKDLGMSAAGLHHIMSGRIPEQWVRLKHLAQLLDTTMDDILEDVD